MPKRLSEKSKLHIAKLYRDGMTMDVIAQRMNLSKATVNKYKEYDQWSKVDPQVLKLIMATRDLAKDGVSLKVITEIIKISYEMGEKDGDG